MCECVSANVYCVLWDTLLIVREGCCVYIERDRKRGCVSGNTEIERDTQSECVWPCISGYSTYHERGMLSVHRERQRKNVSKCVSV